MYKGRRSGSHVQTPRAAPHKEKADHTPAESVEPASRIATHRRDRKARTARQPGARQGSEWPHQDRGTPTPTASNADRRERNAHPRDRRQQRAKGRSTGRQPTEELQVSADFLLGKVEDPRPTGEIIYELRTKLAQIHDLENGTGPMPVDEAAKEHIAIVEVDTAAGAGALVGYEHVIGHMKFAREWLRTQDLVAERCRLIRVIGESMEPTLCRRTAPARRVAARAAPIPPTGGGASSRFFVSVEDPIIARYGIRRLMTVPGLSTSDEPTTNPVLRREIRRAQRSIEGENLDISSPALGLLRGRGNATTVDPGLAPRDTARRAAPRSAGRAKPHPLRASSYRGR